MIPMRHASAEIIYNGKTITASLAEKTGSFTYNDPETGSSDDISLTINDPNDMWINGMFPKLGDKITAIIRVNDWRVLGDNRILNCGDFIIDDPSFSGPPTQVQFKAVSQPSDQSFKSQQRTKTWENVTVQQIVTEIAVKYALLPLYAADEIKIDSIEQSEQTDADFVNSVCEKYNLSCKIYSHKLVVFDRETYKKLPPVTIIDKSGMEQWSYNTTLNGTYTGGTMKYTESDSGEDYEAEYGIQTRSLAVNGKADSREDAEKQIKAAVNEANDNAESMSVTIPGNPSLSSSQSVLITGLGVANGKYYITKVTHSIGGKYTTQLELSKVQIEV
jgi:phage protein D